MHHYKKKSILIHILPTILGAAVTRDFNVFNRHLVIKSAGEGHAEDPYVISAFAWTGRMQIITILFCPSAKMTFEASDGCGVNAGQQNANLARMVNKSCAVSFHGCVDDPVSVNPAD